MILSPDDIERLMKKYSRLRDLADDWTVGRDYDEIVSLCETALELQKQLREFGTKSIWIDEDEKER